MWQIAGEPPRTGRAGPATTPARSTLAMRRGRRRRPARRCADASTPPPNDLPDRASRLLRTVGDAGPAWRSVHPGAPPVRGPGRARARSPGWTAPSGRRAPSRSARPRRRRGRAGRCRSSPTLLDRLRSWIAPTALVRTSSGDVAVAVTALRWAGRTTTAVAAGAGAPELRLHHDVARAGGGVSPHRGARRRAGRRGRGPHREPPRPARRAADRPARHVALRPPGARRDGGSHGHDRLRPRDRPPSS